MAIRPQVSNHVLGIAVLVCVFCATAWVVLYRYKPGQYAILDSVLAAGTRNQTQASLALMMLPELQAWSSQIEQASGGARRGTVIVDDPKPIPVNGKLYWKLSYVENGADTIARWETFLVAVKGNEILVAQPGSARTWTLAQWRADGHSLRPAGQR